jgi:hypothetical protein
MRLVHCLLLFALVSQPIAFIFAAPVQAATESSWSLPQAQEMPGGTIPPVDDDLPPFPGLEELALAPPSDEALAPLVLTPTLPVYLDMQVERWVMAPGETTGGVAGRG